MRVTVSRSRVSIQIFQNHNFDFEKSIFKIDESKLELEFGV